MSITDLRTAVTTAGGTPTRFDQVNLYRELLTAWGGTPTHWTVPNLLRELVTLAGGTPTQWDQVGLLRQLITARSGTPATFYPDALEAQLAGLALLAAPSYLGFVATRGLTMEATTGGTTAMTRISHTATDNITSLQVLFPAWTSNSGGETALGETATWEAAIEYPASTYTRVKFGGSDIGSAASGATLVSDACAVVIPEGAEFWTRSFQNNPSKVMYRLLDTSASNAAKNLCNFGSGVSNVVMGGAFSGGTVGNNITCGPLGIIGTTSKASIVILGDSTTDASSFDTTIDAASGEMGAVRPSLNDIGYCDMSRTSQAALGHTAALAPRRIALAQYASHVFNTLGINDFGSSATVLARQAALYADWGSKPIIATTIMPRSTGAWTLADGTDQTVSNQPAIAQYNDALRGGVAWATGYIEVADVVESARNSGKWKAPNYTGDGTHPNTNAYGLLIASGVYTKSKFVR